MNKEVAVQYYIRIERSSEAGIYRAIGFKVEESGDKSIDGLVEMNTAEAAAKLLRKLYPQFKGARVKK